MTETAIAITVAFYAIILAWLVWSLICNHRAYGQRKLLNEAAHAEALRRIHSGLYSESLSAWDGFEDVSYNRHAWHLFTFRDPFKLYPHWMRPSDATSHTERADA